MITSFFIGVLGAFIGFFVALLPVGSLPTEISSALTYLFALINTMSYVIPVVTLLSALLVVLAFDGVLLLIKIIEWFIRKIPGMQ